MLGTTASLHCSKCDALLYFCSALIVAITLLVNLPASAATTATAISITSDKNAPDNTPVYGETLRLTATVVTDNGGNASGSVVFFESGATEGTVNFIGKATLGKNVAVLIYDRLKAGTNKILASYPGDDKFASSSMLGAPYIQKVGKADATVSAPISSANSSAYGSAVTFSVHISAVAPGTAKPAGKITFKAGTTILGTGAISEATGEASFTSTGTQLATGTHRITAVYDGNSNFNPSSESTAFSQTVTAGPNSLTESTTKTK